jgi:hypothetical protein
MLEKQQIIVFVVLCEYPHKNQRTLELKIMLSTENDEQPKKSGYFTKPVRNITIGIYRSHKTIGRPFLPG